MLTVPVKGAALAAPVARARIAAAAHKSFFIDHSPKARGFSSVARGSKCRRKWRAI
jgi:hypothetical protein